MRRGHGHHPAGGVRPAPGLLLPQHLQPLQPALQVSETESPEAATVSVREVRISEIFYSSQLRTITRYNSNVIRLSNNNLVDTQGLYQLALDLVEIPENIAWLDLSFNDIDEVTDDILE